MQQTTRLKILAAPILLCMCHCANAVTITFDSLTGNNLDPFTAVTEDGFTVTSNTGSWFEGHLAGNETPSIAATGNVASVLVTLSGGGLFTFASVDLNDGSNTRSVDYTITGFSGSQAVFSTTGDVPLEFGSPIFSPSFLYVDSLFIELTMNNSLSANIDNIVVAPSAVPMPTTLALSVSALAALGFCRRKRPTLGS